MINDSQTSNLLSIYVKWRQVTPAGDIGRQERDTETENYESEEREKQRLLRMEMAWVKNGRHNNQHLSIFRDIINKLQMAVSDINT